MNIKKTINVRYPSEESLVKHAVTCLKKKYGLKLVLELDAGVGVADIVLYKRNPRSSKQLKVLSKISPRLAPILDPLNAGKISKLEDLSNFLGIGQPAAKRIMFELQQAGAWINSTKRDGVKKITIPPFEQIISIEAKLSDWQRALVQGYRNLQFADQSWVILDHFYISRVLPHIDKFSRAGVGLASIDVNGEMYFHNKALESNQYSLMKRWHAQASLARRVILTNSLNT